jgi:hypothetical protein
MRTFQQSTGALVQDGVELGRAPRIYSGHGAGLCNPALQADPDIGPIPAGVWEIGTAFDHPHLGPCVMHLAPVEPARALGRAGFFIHGDDAQLNESGSHGCIVAPRPVREAIAASADRRLTVIP